MASDEEDLNTDDEAVVSNLGDSVLGSDSLPGDVGWDDEETAASLPLFHRDVTV